MGAKPFLLFLGWVESNSAILRGGQSILFIFRGGHKEIAKNVPKIGLNHHFQGGVQSQPPTLLRCGINFFLRKRNIQTYKTHKAIY